MRERHFGGRTILTEAHDNTLMLLDFGDNVFALAYGTAAGILSEGTSWDPAAATTEIIEAGYRAARDGATQELRTTVTGVVGHAEAAG